MSNIFACSIILDLFQIYQHDFISVTDLLTLQSSLEVQKYDTGVTRRSQQCMTREEIGIDIGLTTTPSFCAIVKKGWTAQHSG